MSELDAGGGTLPVSDAAPSRSGGGGIPETRNRLRWAAIAVACVCALALRLYFVPFVSEDFTYFFGPWSEHIRRRGLMILGSDLSDYQPSYLYLLALTNMLPIPTLWSVKAIPIAADFVLAWFVFRVVRLGFPAGNRAVAAGLAVLFVPTVVMNSAVWGQCDVLFTTALVATLYYLLAGRRAATCVAYGIAISLKLQAVFFAPILVLAWVKGRLRFRDLLLVPAVHLLTLHPAFYLGRSISSALGVYFKQTQTYKVLQMGAPNLYQWIPNSAYDLVLPIGVGIACAVVAVVLVAMARSSRDAQLAFWVTASLGFVLLLPALLPAMHERYFYAADVLTLIYAFYFPRRAAVAAVIVMASVTAYVPYLFSRPAPLKLAAVALIACTVYVLATALRGGSRYGATAGAGVRR
jgi:Gpi18-like mannosyltransferase